MIRTVTPLSIFRQKYLSVELKFTNKEISAALIWEFMMYTENKLVEENLVLLLIRMASIRMCGL